MTIDKNIRLLKKRRSRRKKKKKKRRERGAAVPFFLPTRCDSGGKEEDYKPPDRGCCL